MNTGEVYRFDRFEDFVTAAPRAGLGADLAKLKAVCKDDLGALDLIDRARQASLASSRTYGRGPPRRRPDGAAAGRCSAGWNCIKPFQTW